MLDTSDHEARDDLSNSGEAGTGTTYERKDKTSSITISVRSYAFSSPDTSIRGLLTALVAIGTDFIPSSGFSKQRFLML